MGVFLLVVGAAVALVLLSHAEIAVADLFGIGIGPAGRAELAELQAKAGKYVPSYSVKPCASPGASSDGNGTNADDGLGGLNRALLGPDKPQQQSAPPPK